MTIEEEVMVLYDSGIVAAISGLSLAGAILSSFASLSSSSSYSSSLPPPLLSFRKWHLFGPEIVSDIIYTGSGRIIAAGRDPILSFYAVNEVYLL
jgi:hypothetical protein